MYEALIYTRSFEIIISLLTGAFLCYLGYRLFSHNLPNKSDLELHWGKLTINLLQVGPGTLFSLFGVLIILYALSNKTKYDEYSDGIINKKYFEKSVQHDIHLDIQNKFNNALKYHENGQFQDAEKVYHSILDSTKIIGQIANNLADIYLKLGDKEKAEIYARFSTTTYPDSITYLNTLYEIQKQE